MGASGGSGLLDAFGGGGDSSSEPVGKGRANEGAGTGASGLFAAFQGGGGSSSGQGGNGRGQDKGKGKAVQGGRGGGKSGTQTSRARHVRNGTIGDLDAQMALRTSGLARPPDGSGGTKRKNHWAPGKAGDMSVEGLLSRDNAREDEKLGLFRDFVDLKKREQGGAAGKDAGDHEQLELRRAELKESQNKRQNDDFFKLQSLGAASKEQLAAVVATSLTPAARAALKSLQEGEGGE